MRQSGRQPGRSMGERVRDAGRSMSRQLSAMVQGAGRAGRAVQREITTMSRSLSAQVPSVPPGTTLGEMGALPYRRSRSRMLARKWRMRRVRPNPIGYFVGFGVIALIASAVIGAGGAGAVYAVGYYQSETGAIHAAAAVGTTSSTRIFDRNGKLLYALQRDSGYQFNVPYNYINPLVITATLDTEDRTFWTNNGVDFLGTIRAALTDVSAGGQAQQGASTITQQLVKSLVLNNREKTLDRKIHEAILALGMTKANGFDPHGFSKTDIITMYLNNIYYDDQNTGIEAAARNYFGYQPIEDANHNVVKEANQQLTLAQIAILARIPNYPTFYYPLSFSCKTAPCPQSQWKDGNESNVLQGAEKVLSDMVAVGDLSEQAKTQTVDQVIQILENQQIYHLKGLSEGTTASEEAVKKAPHFVDYVIDQLISEFGFADQKQVAAAGFSVYTTLDYNLEQFIEKDSDMYIDGGPDGTFTRYWYCPTGIRTKCVMPALKVTDNVHNSAAVAMDPYTGDILAMMGSINYASQDKQVLGFNNMAVLPRSMGSATKPLVYATAFQMGWYPGLMLQDIPLCYPGKQPLPTQTGSKPAQYPIDAVAPACQGYYVAHNYNATSFSGTAPIREMLANSLNIPATETMYFVGANYNTADRFMSMIGRMGVKTCADCPQGAISAARLGPTTALGTQEMPLIELTGAYGVFATGGRHTPPRAILRIDDATGTTIWQAPTPKLAQVMSPQVAYMMTSVLTDNEARGGDFKVENPLCFSIHCYPNDFDYPYIAAKTGTSQGDTGPLDIVTMGYSPYMVLGVWSGNTDPHDSLGSNVIGITGAGYIFHDTMVWALKNYHWPQTPFPIPPDMARAQFNCNSGLAPYKGTDLKAFVDAGPNQPGTGWCNLTYWPGYGGTNLYAGWGIGPWRHDEDWIIQGQFPLIS